jgi:hypothetical protein
MAGTKGFAANLGKFKEAYPNMTVEDITAQPDFEKARNTFIDGVLNQGTGRDFLSILTQNGYELTQDPSQVNENTILVKADSNGLLQPDKESLEKHRGRAREILKEAISVQLDMIESPGGTISAAERLYDRKQGDALKGGGDVYALVAGLSSSDANAVETSATQLMQQFSGIDRIKNIVDATGKNTGMEIYTSGKAQPVPVMFTDPNGNAKTREQITAELFPLFYGDKLSTQQFSEIVSGYTGGLEEGSRNMFQTGGYSTPFIDDDTDTYNLDRSRPREIARTNLVNNEGLLTSASKHTDAITDILEGTASDAKKQNEIRKLNQQYMQQLEPLLRYTDKENKTQSLDLEIDSGGNLVVVDGGKTYTCRS